MTYTPSNRPVPSDAPEDLYFNSAKLDEYVNGAAATVVDRNGVERITLAGIDERSASETGAAIDQFESDGAAALASQNLAFQGFIVSIGRVDKGTYAAGKILTTRSDVFYRNGFYYRAAPSVSLPYTLTGNWATESGNFIVDFGPTNLMPEFYGAQGDGVVDDTAALAALEAAVTGKTVNLSGKTYLVSARPTKNYYTNGFFKVASATFPSDLYNMFLSGVPKFNAYGPQLRRLKEALGDPLVQYVGITLCADSIGWGRTLASNSTVAPQTQQLNTARDNASSPSFWNNLRRHIGYQYMKGATLTLSNWAASPSGESIATYVRPLTIYPKDGPFALTVTGASQSAASAVRATSPTGFMYTLVDGSPGGANYQSIKFNFTGDRFTLILRATNTGDFNNYSLYVDGVLIGTYTTQDGVDGIVAGDNNRRLHSFGYVRNKVVEIRTNSTGLTGVRRLYLEGIEVPKTVRLTNQGVIGLTARTYDLYNLSGSYSSPTAVTPYDQFVFVEFGTNDKGDTDVPPGGAEFERAMQAIVTRLTALGDVIVMCASPVADSVEPSAAGRMTMRDVRGVLSKIAKNNSLAFIDNLAAFDAIDPSVTLNGTIHPNELGHAIMGRNIINALEQA